MLKIALQNVVPPGGYRYIDPDTKHFMKDNTLRHLVDKASAHRKANGLKVPDNFFDVVQDWLCEQMPNGICKSPDGRRVFGSIVHTLESVVSGTSVLTNIMIRGKSAFIPQQEAERRAVICKTCEYNKPTAACLSCRGVKTIMEAAKRGRKTSYDGTLHVCGICSCFNQVQVHMSPEVLSDATPASMINKYPDWCWKKQILKEQ